MLLVSSTVLEVMHFCTGGPGMLMDRKIPPNEKRKQKVPILLRFSDRILFVASFLFSVEFGRYFFLH